MDNLTDSFSVNTSGVSTSGIAQEIIKAARVIKANKDDPHGIILPQEPTWAIPHELTYTAVWNWYQKYYYNYFDESQIDSQQNSLAMRRDGFIEELLRHRQLPTAGLPHSFECDDEDDRGQVEVKKQVAKIVDSIKYFQQLKLQLLEAIFYGKSGTQLVWGKVKVAGKDRISVVDHIPVQGDKIAYDYDGTPGVFVFMGGDTKLNRPEVQKYIKYIDKGPALFFRSDYYRDRFIIHNFQKTDTDYIYESQKGLAVHGLGIRDRFYWTWNMRAELLGWMLNALQRVGANGMLYAFYQSGNPNARDATLAALKNLIQENVAAFPTDFAQNAIDSIQSIEPSPVGYEVLFQIITHLEEIMRRGILGQNLSSQSAATGLGSGVADLQAGSFENIILYDSSCLAETLDDQLIKKILKFNYFEYKGKTYNGADLPFGIRMNLQVTKKNVQETIDAASKLFQMGVELDAEDLRDTAGLKAPRDEATTLSLANQQKQQADMQQQGDTAKMQQQHANEKEKMSLQNKSETNKLQLQNNLKQPEKFSRDETYDRIAYEVANTDSTMIDSVWYHARTNRVIISALDNITYDVLQRLTHAILKIVGSGNCKATLGHRPSGAGWEEVFTNQYVIEPEWYSLPDAPEFFDCGTGAGGFQRGNTCARESGAIKQHYGIEPKYKNVTSYTEEDWKKKFGSEYEELIGRTDALFDNDGNLHLRGENSKSLLHELVHASGIDNKNVSEELNEGLTQAITEDISGKSGIEVEKTYKEYKNNVINYLVPSIGMTLPEIAKNYVNQEDPAKWMADRIWEKNKDLFSDREDWGSNVKESIENTLKSSPWNPFPYLTFITEEKGRKNPEQFARDQSDPSVMISLTIPYPIAEQIAVPSGELPDELHITLAYLGRLSEIGEEAVSTAQEITRLMASNSYALSGLLAGVGRFSSSDSSDGMDVFYANVDIPSLTGFRDELCHVLKLGGVPYKETHGYTPHATLKYLAETEDMPYQRMNPISISFPSLAFSFGGVKTEFPFKSAGLPNPEFV